MAIENLDELRSMLNVALAFHTAAELVEQHVVDAGYRHDDGTRLAATTSRTKREMWMALKAASHFNLQQSFEVFMKFILKLEGTDHRKEHRLGELYDMLSGLSRKHVDSAYKRADGVHDRHEPVVEYAQRPLALRAPAVPGKRVVPGPARSRGDH